MLFHSLDFALFFAVFFPIYWCLPRRPQNVFLLLGSYFFYGYVHPWFLTLLFGSCVADYAYARGMAAFPSRKRLLLICSLCTNLGLLGFFKYFGFFVENVLAIGQALGFSWSRPALQVVLPVGISFYTFQSLSYTIDVYRGRLEARRDFLDFATFLALFPQLVAGPIERATHVLPQVENPRRLDLDALRTGALLSCWGLFKKLVVADNVAVIANKVFSLSEPGFALVWTGTLAFGIQIYADFSAYSDIARGVARLLGFDLMKNFDHPYIAQTPTEFWRRWHISLSSWFRDYVYIPLGGNRRSPARTYFNLFFTFLLSGLWHGASWNFVMWGAYHGLLLILQRVVELRAPWLVSTRWLAPARVLILFGLVQIGWLMFRETETSQLLRNLSLTPGHDSAAQLAAAGHFLGLVGLYASPLVLDTLLYLTGVYRRSRDSWAWATLQGATAALLIFGLVFLYSNVPSDFIYFQF